MRFIASLNKHLIVHAICCASLFLAATIAIPSLGQAQTASQSNARIAVLDYRKVMRDAKAAKQIRADVNKLREKFKGQFSKIEKKLEADRRALIAARSTLSEDAFKARQRKFEQDVIGAQREAQDKRRQVERIFNRAMAQLQKTLIPIVKEETTALGINVVIDESQVFLAARTMTITDRILKKLDAKVQRVPLKLPAK